MKAQLVYENLDFERGKDPKESIGIGSSRGGELLFNLIFEETKTSPDVFIHPKGPSIYGKRDGYWLKRELGGKIEKQFTIVLKLKVSLWMRKEVTIYLMENEEVWGFDNEFKKFYKIKSLKDFYKYFSKTDLI